MNKEDKHIVLFDMDGTLTESRQVIENNMFKSIKELLQISNVEVGVVTGSDYDYVKQQLGLLLSESSMCQKIHVLPCNGTKYYTPPNSQNDLYQLSYDEDMSMLLGKENMRSLMQMLIERQSRFSYALDDLTGHFISYRGSMINWCPIGRNASEEQRNNFIQLDNFYEPSLRLRELRALGYKLTELGLDSLLTVKLGGDTSFDIYPTGWDKRYCLKYFKGYKLWFVGDRCKENGNDYEVFQEVSKSGFAFETDSPEKTCQIIEDIKIKIYKSNYNTAPRPS
jgi:phosphomannomutase